MREQQMLSQSLRVVIVNSTSCAHRRANLQVMREKDATTSTLSMRKRVHDVPLAYLHRREGSAAKKTTITVDKRPRIMNNAMCSILVHGDRHKSREPRAANGTWHRTRFYLTPRTPAALYNGPTRWPPPYLVPATR